jgi:luciferase-like monooxygenase
MALAAAGLQIVHLHQPDDAELYLTWPLILRLSKVLAAAGPVRFWPGDDWIGVPLAADSDVAMLTPLVSLAIQVSVRAQRRPEPQPCPRAAAWGERVSERVAAEG